VDLGVFGFTLSVSLLTGVIFGLIPAWRASKPDLNEGLKDGTKSSAGKDRRRLGSVLVACDVALALVLLIGAGLMMRSFVRLLDVKPGFDASNVLTLQVSLWGAKYKDDAPESAFYQQALERVRAIHGVEDAAIVSQLPLGGNLDKYGLTVEDKPNWNTETNPSADRYSISPSYLRTMRIPLLRGREFTDQDRKDSPAVVIVSQALAQMVWPGEDPIGKRIRIADPKGPWRSVVGVVGDVLHGGLDAPHTPQLYLPHTQFTDSDMLMVVRTAKDPAALASDVRSKIASVDPLQPVYEIETMKEIVAASVAQRRFSAQLFGLFAAIALVLAIVGIYGVVSYAVAQRTREIGIRMALGAQPREVLAMVLGDGMKPVLAGAIAGLAAAFGLTRVLSSFLFQVQPTDPAVFAGILLLLVAAATLACSIPARRATRVDPVVALRYE
jgi:putative ABC transport system permease protein